MIIWINGAFGAGKTETALELNSRLKKSFIYDPENLGEFINKNIPNNMKKGDFQDYLLWREINVKIIKDIYDKYNGTIMIPMTIVNKKYYDEVIEKLRKDGISVNHFTLIVTKDILIKRLKSRGEDENSWPAKQIERCNKGLIDDTFENKIYSSRMTIEEVVVEIADKCNLELLQ
ncbi:AAA family ATPase [Clostridium frigidicarnis]|uniref:AAA domain-containing protein n=1 Tax=Clostridium frigidicarnis TaxID=84698 RepID=A0A1I1AK30_9CLOT|nr:AAA family ATPase [Clostridium frigidicarnis]SFB37852.1 AAA domain-containing protein [Clostridium frigidicarnis]